MSIDTAKLFCECVNINLSLIKPEQKLCTSCRSEVVDNIKVSKISMKKNPL
jgi:hypothetical protein